MRLTGGTDCRPVLLAALSSSKPLGRPLKKSFLCLFRPSHKYNSILAWTVQPAGPKLFFPGNCKLSNFYYQPYRSSSNTSIKRTKVNTIWMLYWCSHLLLELECSENSNRIIKTLVKKAETKRLTRRKTALTFPQSLPVSSSTIE